MRVHFLKSATTLVETNGVRILTDPWLVDGEYYGAWYHYPPYKFDPGKFSDVDYIYISHIHPDHFSRATLSRLSRDIPVLVHGYEVKFLKRNIESLGFQVTELEHNKRIHLRDDVHINILAADNCDPEMCMKFFGCGRFESKYGSSQIDSLSVIDDGKHTLVNVNDCPFPLARKSAELVKQQYDSVDFLFVGYAGAGPYPQCMANMSLDEKKAAAAKKQEQFLSQGVNFIELFKPKAFMPFAGTYTLGGYNAKLNSLRGVPEIEEALQYLDDHSDSRGVLLNSGCYFDLETGRPSATYQPMNFVEKQTYINEVLARIPYTFANDPEPAPAEILELIPSAIKRMEDSRNQISFSSPTKVVIPFSEKQSAVVPMDGQQWSVIDRNDEADIERFVRFKVDPRLLLRILKGPRFGHWNNAEIGSHIEFYRKPEQFERGLYYCMNFFFA